MAGKAQETLFQYFRSIADESLAVSSRQMQESSDTRAGMSGSETTIPLVGNPPPAVPTATSAGGGNSALDLAGAVFGSGLGLVSLVSGLMGLFGSGSSGPPPLTRYAMPQTLDFTGALTGSGIAEASFNQIGTARLSGDATENPTGGPSTATSGNPSPNASTPQVNVTVQAMDAQSFLDRSSDIAQAVRQAMLNLSSLNDVVSEL